MLSRKKNGENATGGPDDVADRRVRKDCNENRRSQASIINHNHYNVELTKSKTEKTKKLIYVRRKTICIRNLN